MTVFSRAYVVHPRIEGKLGWFSHNEAMIAATDISKKISGPLIIVAVDEFATDDRRKYVVSIFSCSSSPIDAAMQKFDESYAQTYIRSNDWLDNK